MGKAEVSGQSFEKYMLAEYAFGPVAYIKDYFGPPLMKEIIVTSYDVGPANQPLFAARITLGSIHSVAMVEDNSEQIALAVADHQAGHSVHFKELHQELLRLPKDAYSIYLPVEQRLAPSFAPELLISRMKGRSNIYVADLFTTTLIGVVSFESAVLQKRVDLKQVLCSVNSDKNIAAVAATEEKAQYQCKCRLALVLLGYLTPLEILYSDKAVALANGGIMEP